MRRVHLILTVLLFALSAPVAAQSALTADLVKDITQAEEKFVALAKVFNAQQAGWRPGEGVRSVQEVLLHVAADNYFLPAAMGVAAPPATKITATDFNAMMAFEKQELNQAGTVAAVEASFDHLRTAFNGISEARMNEKITVFGQEFTVRQFMILAATHMHEHLGQLIAYARMNGVKPPWSR
jgi:uncharacterized damage-inducible protein DinB